VVLVVLVVVVRGRENSGQELLTQYCKDIRLQVPLYYYLDPVSDAAEALLEAGGVAGVDLEHLRLRQPLAVGMQRELGSDFDIEI
jgi:hypothetical protein